MTHLLTYCRHCGSRYYYQASGYGCHEPLNDSLYCPRCKQLIIEALKDIEPTTVAKFVPVDEKEAELTKKKCFDIINRKRETSTLSVVYEHLNIDLPDGFCVKYIVITKNGDEYVVSENNDGTIECYVNVDIEVSTNTVVGNHYTKHNSDCCYVHGNSLIKSIPNTEVKPQRLESPTMSIFFLT